MKKRINKIGLNKLFLWQEAERIQIFPEAFSRLEPDRIYSRRELATEVFGLAYKDEKSSHPIRGEVLRNIFGLGPLGEDKINISGFNAFARVSRDQYRPNPLTVDIGDAYKSAKDEDEWTYPFARLLCRFEVRTRLMLHLIGKAGYCLMFETPAFFANPSSKARLEKEDETIPLFVPAKGLFNQLLQDYRHIALGRWWKEEIQQDGYDLNPEFSFVGMRGAAPSMDKLNSTFKCSLFLFKYLGMIESRQSGWMIYPKRTKEVLGKELAEDFLEEIPEEKEKTLVSKLQEIVVQMQEAEGFVVVSSLAKRWARLNGISITEAELQFDEFMRELLYDGKARILARHQGQPRHGRGLFGDDSARMIKLEF